MKKLKFTKDPQGWFIDLPEWKGSKADLEMVAGADKFLERIGKGKSPVVLLMSEKKINGFEKLTKIMNTPFVGGALYSSNYWPVWLCDVTKFVFGGRLPGVLYYKVNEKQD